MDAILPLIGVGTAVFLAALAWESFGRRRPSAAAVTALPTGATFATKPLLTESEAQLYNMLRLAVQDRYLVFAQIPLWCMLDLRVPPSTPRNELLRELALKCATFALVHPGTRKVEKVVQVDPEEQSGGSHDALLESALAVVDVQVVRLRAGQAYTVPGLITVLDLAEPD
ncbi:MAG TPA: DUF2726 domain-containing protein [Nitrospiraceae bacterium]|jgi:hypothetical protein|nr:DUF2726 domain-containing protein [Nitrospiraceae bacterium]